MPVTLNLTIDDYRAYLAYREALDAITECSERGISLEAVCNYAQWVRNEFPAPRFDNNMNEVGYGVQRAISETHSS